MDVISLGNHVIRKALCLSLTEMAVLCQVLKLTTPKYGYWCIQSKQNMANYLDVSADTVFRALNALEMKGLIEKSNERFWRPTNLTYNLNSAQDISILIQSNDIELISIRVKELEDDYAAKCGNVPQNRGDAAKPVIELPQNAADVAAKCGTKYKERKKKENIYKKNKIFQAPSIEDVIEYFKEKGYKESFARSVHEYYASADWHDSKGNPVKNWKQKCISVWLNEKNKHERITENQEANTSQGPTLIPLPDSENMWASQRKYNQQ